MQKYSRYIGLICFLISCTVYGGRLALVIVDIGYQYQRESLLLEMPAAISIAILPNAPHAHLLATNAHQHGHEVLIHLPMAPLTPQSLEKNTLYPDMSQGEISRIIREASNKVPYATGVNNHMGSAMTRSLPGMQKVMQVLAGYHYYFLDSMTVSNSQSTLAAVGTGVHVIRRQIFLDHDPSEAAIRKQFERAVNLARSQGWAVVIGHRYPATIGLLQQMIPVLPPDITLVSPSMLLNQVADLAAAEPADSYPGEICIAEHPLPQIAPIKTLKLIGDSIIDSPLVTRFRTPIPGPTSDSDNAR